MILLPTLLLIKHFVLDFYYQPPKMRTDAEALADRICGCANREQHFPRHTVKERTMSENTSVELYQIAPTYPLPKVALVRAINELQSPRTNIKPALHQSLMQRVHESGVIFWDEKRARR